ncbi:hypothetical protein [Streptomyces sp. cmx-18-6]|uniref:hypothetical protein n=1 Tax=Streptomyces sp. cmx-18-6 TaxID=2790930 RepID=UPI00397EF82E
MDGGAQAAEGADTDGEAEVAAGLLERGGGTGFLGGAEPTMRETLMVMIGAMPRWTKVKPTT